MSTLQVNTINESTSGSGVTIDGVKLKDNIVETDTINEKTSTSGVTIDGVLIKDGLVDGKDVSALGGINGVQTFRLTANRTGGAGYITANWEEDDTDYEALGSFISESSGVFSFSSTGKYLIITFAMMYSTGYNNVQTYVDSGDGTFTSRARASGVGNSHENGASSNCFVDVTSTDFKVKLYSSNNNNSTVVYGDTDYNKTAITFIRICDT
tara:strand:+ start:160 stop:792 length:633 start_codon:yes stop_codon:yes gene_type:complete